MRFAISKMWAPRKRRPEGAVYAVACDSFTGQDVRYTGTVLFRGEYWRAQSPAPVFANQYDVITSRQGLLLKVTAPPQENSGAYR